MSTDNKVKVAYGENAEETAVLLLAAVEEAGLPASVVTTGSFGHFFAPESVAQAAGVDYEVDGDVDHPDQPFVEVATEPGQPDPYVRAGDSESALPTSTEVEVYDPADHTVQEVLDYLAEHPEQREAVIASEQSGKNRVTITESE